MDILQASRLLNWDELDRIQDDILKHMAEYPQISGAYDRFNDQIHSALGPDLIRFDTAQSAYLALQHRASLLTGVHAALRLLTLLRQARNPGCPGRSFRRAPCS